MPIPCPSCGRAYDAALFEHGRTIHCTCGARVGLEEPLPLPFAHRPLRFLADAMLGRLARWLRTLGFDTAFDAAASDAELVRRAHSEGRVLLTLDRRLPAEWRTEAVVLLPGENLRAQLRHLHALYDLAGRARPFTRCTVCNLVLEPRAAAEVASRVPERVLASCSAFAECPSCGRVYWEGSHTRRMRGALEELLHTLG